MNFLGVAAIRSEMIEIRLGRDCETLRSEQLCSIIFAVVRLCSRQQYDVSTRRNQFAGICNLAYLSGKPLLRIAMSSSNRDDKWIACELEIACESTREET